MATASTAGAWQSGARPDRPYPARAPRPSVGSERPTRGSRPSAPVPGRAGDRLRAAEREYGHDRFEAAPAPRRGSDRPRPTDRPQRPERPERAERPGSRGAQAGARPRTAAPAARESKLRGVVAVAGMFLLTLAGCGIDSFVGTGLGLITLVALAASTSMAALLVRRRDLLTVVVAPPLVFVLVAVVNAAVAPSATLNAATIATLLVRGFPTMAAATVAAVLLALFRLVSRR
ncbi:hypothetical protein DQ237_16095 [Blastococcus sp. TF02-8]|uniref:DUF6542 domain-containing protein n=1 Tax=Blastococcus sp. TF02-8 TaxID=2250574 RepID=UPI000DEBBAA8|nr:DUF6542 domain-containing protein [Blastococcus sp. TF02-8]RBY95198.1 hypothetical protein DQ237_16095 [Blastococcus sp. TF02-8]